MVSSHYIKFRKCESLSDKSIDIPTRQIICFSKNLLVSFDIVFTILLKIINKANLATGGMYCNGTAYSCYLFFLSVKIFIFFDRLTCKLLFICFFIDVKGIFFFFVLEEIKIRKIQNLAWLSFHINTQNNMRFTVRIATFLLHFTLTISTVLNLNLLSIANHEMTANYSRKPIWCSKIIAIFLQFHIILW